MAPAIPLVETSDDAHALSIGGPDGKTHTFRAGVLDQLRTQFFVHPEVRPIPYQVQVKIAEHGRIPVRILRFVASFGSLAGAGIVIENS
jgi:hypothetical protein